MSKNLNYQSMANRYINPIHDNFKKNIEFLTLESVIPVGKHKGKLLKEVMEIDFQYVLWARKNNVFLFSLITCQIIKDKYKITKKVYTQEENDAFFSKINEKREANKTDRNQRISQQKVCIPIYLFDENKSIVKCYDSINDCAAELQINSQVITYAIKTKRMVKEKYYFSKSLLGFIVI